MAGRPPKEKPESEKSVDSEDPKDKIIAELQEKVKTAEESKSKAIDDLKKTEDTYIEEVSDLKKTIEDLQVRRARVDQSLVEEKDRLKERIKELEVRAQEKTIGIGPIPEFTTVVPRVSIHFWGLVDKKDPYKIYARFGTKDAAENQKKKFQTVEHISLRKPGKSDYERTSNYRIPREMALELVKVGHAFITEAQYYDYKQYPEVYNSGRKLMPEENVPEESGPDNVDFPTP